MAEASTAQGSIAGAEEVHHSSIWPFVIAMAALFGFAGVVFNLLISVFGFVLLWVGVGGWLLQDRHMRFGAPDEPTESFPFTAISIRKLGIWIFLASEVMFFTALIGNSFALRVRSETLGIGWAAPGQVLNVPLTAINTFILIASSFTMVEALRAAERGNQSQLKMFLLATFLLGAIFVGIQAYEYNKLFFGEGLRPWGVDSAQLYASLHNGESVPLWWHTFGTTFFVQTGFHGAHVTGGVIALGFLTGKAFKGGYTAKDHEGIELVGLYWHLVDVVWIFLFTIVYLV